MRRDPPKNEGALLLMQKHPMKNKSQPSVSNAKSLGDCLKEATYQKLYTSTDIHIIFKLQIEVLGDVHVILLYSGVLVAGNGGQTFFVLLKT